MDDNLITIINKLQDVFNAIGHSTIDLPQIVVIGSQSSGKSSVLEKIVGHDFLPRGTGIVTRRPLVLQLFNLPLSNEKNEEYAEFLHLPGQKFTDFTKVRTEIETETDRLTGSNKGISNESINLKIYSPHVLNLTLVDLPGITKVPLGDQPANIEEQIREMCFKFISNPNSIILAVTAANTDLANSDALKMAKHVDPEGLRTIGVLTKLDLMDDGTDAIDMLQGRVIPLKRGFVGIINRSQAEIKANTPIRDSVKKENDFFATHPSYRSLAGKIGSTFLAKTLNTLLMGHIKDCLPEIKTKINTLLGDLSRDMTSLGEPLGNQGPSHLGATLLTLLSHFASNFADSLEGRHRSTSGIEMSELYGGARINYIFNEIFTKSLMAVDPFDHMSDDDIRTAIRNANGSRQSLFIPEVSFEILAKRQLSRLEQPGLQCVDLVYSELQRVTAQCETVELTRFADLRERVMDVVNDMLRKSLVPTQGMITNLIKIELAHVNTSHPDFIGGSQSIAVMMESMQLDKQQSSSMSASNNINTTMPGPTAGYGILPSESTRRPSDANNPLLLDLLATTPSPYVKSVVQEPSSSISNRHGHVSLPNVPLTMRQGHEPSQRETIEMNIIKSLLASYFDIVRKNFLDLVPKTIMCFLVNAAKDNVQNELVSSLYKEDQLKELLRENDDIAKRRDTAVEMRKLYTQALGIVNEVRDFNSFKP